MEFPAAGPEESLLDLDANLLERFQAIGHEAGAGDVDPPDTLLRQSNQRVLRIGL